MDLVSKCKILEAFIAVISGNESKWVEMGQKMLSFQIILIVWISKNWIEWTWCQNATNLEFFPHWNFPNKMGQNGFKNLSF